MKIYKLCQTAGILLQLRWEGRHLSSRTPYWVFQRWPSLFLDMAYPGEWQHPYSLCCETYQTAWQDSLNADRLSMFSNFIIHMKVNDTFQFFLWIYQKLVKVLDTNTLAIIILCWKTFFERYLVIKHWEQNMNYHIIHPFKMYVNEEPLELSGGTLCKWPYHPFSLWLLRSTEPKLKMNHRNHHGT